MYKLTKNLFLLAILFFSCGNAPEKSAKLISPSENLRITTSSKYIFESNTLQLSENEIEAYVSTNDIRIIATKESVSIVDYHSNKLKKKYKFKFDNFKELISIHFSMNTSKSKLLVTTSSGQDSTALIFQIDLTSFQIDWLTEYSKQIETARYSNKSDLIALGTNYYNKKSAEKTSEYYSSLFLLDSTTGRFIDYFEQGESVLKIQFSEDDNFLCAILGWPHSDTFVWKINNKNEKLNTFGKDDTSFYDACIIDKETFIAIGSDGIYKWNLSDADNHKVVYTNDSNYFNGTNKIYKLDTTFVVIDYPNGSANPPIIRHFNSDFKLIDSVAMKTTFDNIMLIDSKLVGLGADNTIISYDIRNKSVSKKIIELK